MPLPANLSPLGAPTHLHEPTTFSQVAGQPELKNPSREEQPKAHRIVIEHLGFQPMEVVDQVVNAVNQVLYQMLGKLGDFCDQQYPDGYDGELETGLAHIETLLERALDRAFDAFEIFCLRHAFYASPDLPVRLPYQKEMNLSATDEDEQRADAELASLRNEVAAKTLYLACIKYKEARLDRTLATAQKHLAALGKMQEASQGGPSHLSSIQPKFASLMSLIHSTLSAASRLSDPQSFRDERTEHIRAAVDRQVERMRRKEREAREAAGGDEPGKQVAGKVVNIEKEWKEAMAIGRVSEVQAFREELQLAKRRRLDAELDESEVGKENVAN